MSADRDASLPVIDPGAVESDRSASVAGLLLSAGESSRFEGGNKLLATLDGEPLVRHAALSLVDARLEPRIAVLGNDAPTVETALDGLDFEFVHNPDYAAGQSASVRRGVAALSDVDAVVIALGDMPRVDPASMRALVRVYESGRASALAAACDGKRGNPVLFDRRYFDALTDVDGDTGGREILLEGEHSALVETGDPGVLRDVDTRADLATLAN
jgi:molybdenum cofactor cytidylyltransferase